jgi:hypothetical protein
MAVGAGGDEDLIDPVAIHIHNFKAQLLRVLSASLRESA